MPKTPTISFVSLGCSKNLVDSERMLGLLAQGRYAIVPESEPADLMIVNTCGFIETARQESIGVIEEMIGRKRLGHVKGVVVAGCLAEREKESLLERFPEVDDVVGVFGREEIVRVADRLLGGLSEQRGLFRPAPCRRRTTARAADHAQTPRVSQSFRRLRSTLHVLRHPVHARQTCDQTDRDGRRRSSRTCERRRWRELILVAQDMTYYGVDLYGRPRLSDLLKELEQVEGIDWLRILYCYPQFFTDELYDVLGGSRKIIPYLDMPLQHISDRLLKQMNRRHTRQESEAIISRLRATIPGLVLRTTFIVGFPGETEAEFDELVNFVEATKFERLGVFPYSLEGDTPAAKIPGHLPEAVIFERRDRVMAAQQPIAFAFNQSLVGRTLDVLIDAPAPEGRHLWLGRSYADAPDVDGVTWVRGSELETGDMVSCKIVASEEYDLVGRMVSPSSSRRKSRPRPRKRPPPGRLAVIEHS